MSNNIGSFNGRNYDPCAYAQQLNRETSPLTYRMYDGYGENNQKLIYDRFYRKDDSSLVDTESELQNRTRRSSKCIGHQYNPACPRGPKCTSTYDSHNPIIPPPELKPPVHTNIVPATGPGYVLPNRDKC